MTRLLLLLLLGGCAAHRTPSWERPGLPFGAVSADILDHMVQNGDATWAGREDSAKIEDAVESWKGALRYRPNDAAILVRLSRAARLRAHTLSSLDAQKQANEAVGWAEKALAARNPQLAERAGDAKKNPTRVFEVAALDDVPALVAYAEALFDWAELHSTATLVSQRDWIVAAADRASQLDRTAQFGAPDRLLGIMWSTMTQDLGGNLRDAEERFESALGAAPLYLPTRLDYAERYCVRMRDGKRYRRLLEEVAQADPDALPAAAPENRAAKKRAQTLLAEGRSW